MPPDETAMPVEDRLRRDEERRPPLAGHELCEQSNECPVGPGETRSGDLATKYCELVAKHKDLGVLLDVVHSVDAHESEGAVNQAVEEGEDHGQGASPKAFVQVKLWPEIVGPFKVTEVRSSTGSRGDRLQRLPIFHCRRSETDYVWE
jgi:hypothetical protein